MLNENLVKVKFVHSDDRSRRMWLYVGYIIYQQIPEEPIYFLSQPPCLRTTRLTLAFPDGRVIALGVRLQAHLPLPLLLQPRSLRLRLLR